MPFSKESLTITVGKGFGLVGALVASGSFELLLDAFLSFAINGSCAFINFVVLSSLG